MSKKLKLISILTFIILLIAFVYFLNQPFSYTLKPVSPKGIKIISLSTGSFRSIETSHLYIKYPTSHKLVDTHIKISLDEVAPITDDDSPYTLEWIDNHHAKVTYPKENYSGPRDEYIIKY